MRKALIVKCHSEGLAPLALNDGNICHAELGSASLAFEIPKQVRNDKSSPRLLRREGVIIKFPSPYGGEG